MSNSHRALNILKKMKETREKLDKTPIKIMTCTDIAKINFMSDECKFILSEVLRYIIENGKYPTNSDFKSSNGYPNCARIYTCFNDKYSGGLGLKGAISHLHAYGASRNLVVPKIKIIEKISYKEKYSFFNTIEKNLIDVLKCQTDGRFKHKYRNVNCEQYGNIIFKFSSLNKNIWSFNLRKQMEYNQDIDNFICIATDYNLTTVNHVWFIMNNKFSNIKNLKIYNTENSLNRLNSYDITDTFNLDSLIN